MDRIMLKTKTKRYLDTHCKSLAGKTVVVTGARQT